MIARLMVVKRRQLVESYMVLLLCQMFQTFNSFAYDRHKIYGSIKSIFCLYILCGLKPIYPLWKFQF